MTSSMPGRTPDPAPNDERDGDDFAEALLNGLAETPKRIASKYFYDAAGSALFDRICELPEYYPYRTEMAVLKDHAVAIADIIGKDAEIVEFGAGALDKVRTLLDGLKAPRAYVPIDISGDYLRGRVAGLVADYPGIAIEPVVADFTGPLDLGRLRNGAARRAGFFPGSTIGNFTPDEATRFLESAALLCRGGGLLVGVDLVKEPNLLHAAYNDAAGVTAAFNKNLLARANRDLGADFDLDRFVHYALYNPFARRVEMTLISQARQTVMIGTEEIIFGEGEAIHTEYSHKYTLDGFRSIAAKAGFNPRAVWCDPARLFSVHWLEAR